MRVVSYQLAKLMTTKGERWCILLDIGDNWFKLVQDFPQDRKDDAEGVLDQILLDRNEVGDISASKRRTFHHQV
jgi:hypothetical protein